jgi:hypothetical protein
MKALILSVAMGITTPSHAAENTVVNLMPISMATVGPIVFQNEQTGCRYVGELRQATTADAWIVPITKTICQVDDQFRAESTNLTIAIGSLKQMKPAQTVFGIYPRTKALPNGAPMVDGSSIASQISTHMTGCTKAAGKPCTVSTR